MRRVCFVPPLTPQVARLKWPWIGAIVMTRVPRVEPGRMPMLCYKQLCTNIKNYLLVVGQSYCFFNCLSWNYSLCFLWTQWYVALDQRGALVVSFDREFTPLYSWYASSGSTLIECLCRIVIFVSFRALVTPAVMQVRTTDRAWCVKRF